jgi:hypothetical protein
VNNFMMDLETLGTTPGCVILSIGVVAFDPFADQPDDVMHDEGFYTVVNKTSCIDALLHVDNETAMWWAKQDEAARAVLIQAADPEASVPLYDALQGMVDYVSGHCAPKQARVWGNGADFDNPIVAVAARHAQIEIPWKWGNRCYRTVKNLHEFIEPGFFPPPVSRAGTHHNALDDARTQALHLWDVLRMFRNYKKEA